MPVHQGDAGFDDSGVLGALRRGVLVGYAVRGRHLMASGPAVVAAVCVAAILGMIVGFLIRHL